MLARGLPPVMIILLYSVPTVRSLALWLKSMCSSYAKKLLTWRERFLKLRVSRGGELSNSAKFFSSFANVSKENCSDLKGTFATNCRTMWHSWKYEERIAVANQVDKFKQSL